MSDWSFSFISDNGFFLQTPYKILFVGLPANLRDKVYNDVEATKRFVGVGPDDAFFYGRRTPRAGDTWTFRQGGGASDSVTKWLNETDGAVQICWGPENTWIACSSKGAAYWSGALPQHVKNAVSGFHPVKVVLGVDHTYVLVDGHGRVKWNLRSKYGGLDEILRNSTSAVEAIALNPKREGQYFVLFKNGLWRAMLPSTYLESVSQAVNESLKQKAEFDKQMMDIVNQGLMEQQRIMNNFYMNMSNNMANMF